MRNKFLILLLLIVALMITACGGGEAPVVETEAEAPAETEAEAPAEEEAEAPAEEEAEAPAEEMADAPEAINVGAVVSLTGPFAGGGAQIERGYQMAVEDINAAGGIYVEEYDAQIPLEITLLDDESDPNTTVSHLETLNSDQEVVAYLGGFSSTMNAAAAAIAEKNQIPYLGVAFALQSPHDQGLRYLFSPFPKSPDLSDAMFEMVNAYTTEENRPTRVAIFQEQTDWGIELGGLWQESADKFGYEVVVYEEYAPGTTDYTDLILKAQEAEANMVLALPTPPDGFTLYKQMGELGYSPDFSFMVRAADVPTWRDLGTVGDYVVLAPGWHSAMTYPGVEELNARHVEMMERPADPMVGPAYSLIQILADSIERAGTLDREAVRDAIAATDMTAMIGPVTFREDGTGVVVAPFLQYQEGNIELVWPQEFATADLVVPAPPFDER
ncbi:MAG: amino acid ABC transporter substrate-binding protein [Candidatus Promineifilaceae bacterium]|nr:amino acid ABC transporter substrate-binding protein [Candidatus Promineifilaceae bacterium]